MKRKTAAFVLVLALIALCACRPSEALVDTVYTMNAPDVDFENTSYIDNNINNEERTDELFPEKIDEDSNDPRERVHHDPVPGEGDSDILPPEIRQDENAASDMDSTYGGQTGEDDVPASGEAQHAGAVVTIPVEAPDGENNDAIPEQKDTRRQIENAYGDIIDIPENVERVTASGEAALIVQMLGGGGRLAATSAGFASNSFARTVFTDEAFPEMDVLWDDAGDHALGEEAFQALLQKSPQVCFEISGQNTFSENQITRLKENGIAHVVLPVLNSHSAICRAVKIVGEVLGDACGVDARARADEYLAFCKSILQKAGHDGKFSPDNINYDTGEHDSSFSSDNGKYSLFIYAWDANASYTLHDDSSISFEGTGLPVAITGYTLSPMSYYMSVAGVANSAALLENNYSIIMTQARYVNPIRTSNKALAVSGGMQYSDSGYVLTTAGGNHLGEPGFPAIIAANAAVKNGILASPLWCNYGYVSSASGLTNGYGFLDDSGHIVATTIQGSFDIHINPQGVGSWTDGSAESILEPLWIAHTINGTVSRETLRSEIIAFYDNFYRYSLTDTELDAILSGR